MWPHWELVYHLNYKISLDLSLSPNYPDWGIVHNYQAAMSSQNLNVKWKTQREREEVKSRQ